MQIVLRELRVSWNLYMVIFEQENDDVAKGLIASIECMFIVRDTNAHVAQ